MNTPSTWGSPRGPACTAYRRPRPALPGHHRHTLPVEVRWSRISQRAREEVGGATTGIASDPRRRLECSPSRLVVPLPVPTTLLDQRSIARRVSL